MPQTIRVLISAGSIEGSDRVLAAIRSGGFDPVWRLLHGREPLLEALAEGGWDVLIADFAAMGSPLDWFTTVWERSGEIQLIIIGDQLPCGEEALKAIRSGARDWIPREDLSKLVPALERAMIEVRDRRSRLEAETALRRSEETYRRLFEEAMTGNCIWATDGRVLACNAVFASIFGLSRKEENLMLPNDTLFRSAVEWGAFVEAVRSHGSVQRYHAHCRRADGIEIEILQNAHGAFDEGGRLVSVNACVLDITEQKRVEAQFLQSQKVEAIGRLACSVAHDFNNMLTAINGYTELLLSKAPPRSPTHRRLTEILRASHQASGLTRRLLSLSRRHVLHARVLDLNVMIWELVEMFQRVLGERITVRTFLEPSIHHVRANGSHLEQAILNLIINARDAIHDTGRITIETQNVFLDPLYADRHPEIVPGAYVMLAVSDTGCGMDDRVKRHLFEPFFTTKDASKGSGLGLSTVHEIVKQEGGHVVVHSIPGQGSTFKIYLPPVYAPAEAATEPQASASPQHPDGTILLVEDDEMVRAFVSDALETDGSKVVIACNGTEAIRLFERHRKELRLLLTDVVLPDTSGPELFQHLRKGHPSLKVLYMSGYPSHAIVQQLILKRHDPFLEKPFTPKALLQKIRSLLELRTNRRKIRRAPRRK